MRELRTRIFCISYTILAGCGSQSLEAPDTGVLINDAGIATTPADGGDSGLAECVQGNGPPTSLQRPGLISRGGTYDGLVACEGGTSVFRIDLQSTSTHFFARYDSSRGALRMELLGRAGPDPVATSTSFSEGAQFSYPSAAPGNHWLRISRADMRPEPLSYDLIVDASESPDQVNGRCEEGEYPPISEDCEARVRGPVGNGGEAVVEGCGSGRAGWHGSNSEQFVWTYATCCGIQPEDHKERAEWYIDVQKAGHYDLLARLPPGNSTCPGYSSELYATDVTYEIQSAGGTQRVSIDQRLGAAYYGALPFRNVPLPVGTSTVVVYDHSNALPECNEDPGQCWRCGISGGLRPCKAIFVGPLEVKWVRP